MINAVILKQVHKPAVGILAVNDPPDVFQHGAQNYMEKPEAEYPALTGEPQARPVSPKSVSEQIKAYMLEARLSKGEVANALGVDPRTVARHRSGTAIPRLDQVHGYEQLFSKRLNRPVRLEMP